MRIYQSSIRPETLDLIARHCPEVMIHVLRSYLVDGPGTFKILASRPKNIKSIALDSGTWSISQNTHKHHINVYNYERFLNVNSKFYNFYFGFDPVHGDEGTEVAFENQQYLESKGYSPIPVIQNLALEVDYYCSNNKKYPLVAIGSTRKKKYDDLKKAVIKLYSAGIKVHLFGIGSLAKLIDIPAWSSDCSSFAQWVKSGRLIFFDRSKNKEVSLATREFNKSGKPNKDYIRRHRLYDEYEEWINCLLGLTVDDIMFDNDLKIVANCLYFHDLEKQINVIHKSRGFTFDVY